MGNQSLRFRSRKEFKITLTELKLIAALAHIGETKPKAAKGKHKPL